MGCEMRIGEGGRGGEGGGVGDILPSGSPGRTKLDSKGTMGDRCVSLS